MKKIRRPLIFLLYIIVTEPGAPIIYLALIFQGHFLFPSAFHACCFAAQFIGSRKKVGTKHAMWPLFACPFDCFCKAARSSVPINIYMRVYIFLKVIDGAL